MRIAFIHPRYPGAGGTGATFSATQIVSGISETEHDITVFCLRKPEEDISLDVKTEFVDRSGYPYHPILQRNHAVIDNMSRFEKFDLVHSYSMTTIPSLSRISAQTEVKTIVSLNAYRGICPKNDLIYHTGEICNRNGPVRCSNCIVRSNVLDGLSGVRTIAYRSPALKEVVQKPYTDIDGFHALSDHVKQRYSEFGYDSDKITVIPNILDERFAVEHRSDFEPPYKFLYVGSLKPRKGVEKLPAICNGVAKQTDLEFELTIVGEGELAEKISNEFDKYGIGDRVRMKGQVPNDQLPELYSSHDLFVYPGIWDEPFGRIFLEALAAGTPILSSDVGSIRSITNTGSVIVDGSVEEFVNSLVDILESERLPSLSANAVQESDRFRQETIIPQFLRKYDQIIHDQ